MSVSLQQFNSWKNEIEGSLVAVEHQLTELEYSVELKRIFEIKDNLLRDRFQVIVVGEFARGKSMFVNALMGKAILPSSPRPSTAIRNTIVFSEEPYIEIYYHDKKKDPFRISEASFKKLVAPMEPISGDAASEKEYEIEIERLREIQYAEVGYPLAICKEGVTLLDTPGLGDLDANRAAITNELIPGSDVAIFIISATKALSLSEMNLLTDRLFKNDIQKIFVVINFKDALMEDGDDQRVYDKVKKDLEGLVPEENIYLVSAFEQLKRRRFLNGEVVLTMGTPIEADELWTEEDTGFAALQEDLSNFLQYNSGAVKLIASIKKTQRVLNDVIHQTLFMEKNAMNLSQDTLNQQVKKFNEQLKNVRVTGNQAQQKLRETMNSHESTVQLWYETELNHITQAGLAAIDDATERDLAEIPQLVDAAIASLERDLQAKAQSRKKVIMEIALDRAGSLLNNEWTKFEDDFTTVFNMQVSQQRGAIDEKQDNGEPIVEKIVNFEDILDELTWDWKEKSIANKIASGVAVAATSVMYAVSLFMGMLNSGSNEKAKLRSTIQAQLRETKKDKFSAFKSDWKSSVESFSSQYGVLIDRQISSKEEQLQKMLRNMSKQGDELKSKFTQLELADHNLRHIAHQLDIMAIELIALEGSNRR